jgi:hypothetical protein
MCKILETAAALTKRSYVGSRRSTHGFKPSTLKDGEVSQITSLLTSPNLTNPTEVKEEGREGESDKTKSLLLKLMMPLKLRCLVVR